MKIKISTTKIKELKKNHHDKIHYAALQQKELEELKKETYEILKRDWKKTCDVFKGDSQRICEAPKKEWNKDKIDDSVTKDDPFTKQEEASQNIHSTKFMTLICNYVLGLFLVLTMPVVANSKTTLILIALECCLICISIILLHKSKKSGAILGAIVCISLMFIVSSQEYSKILCVLLILLAQNCSSYSIMKKQEKVGKAENKE